MIVQDTWKDGVFACRSATCPHNWAISDAPKPAGVSGSEWASDANPHRDRPHYCPRLSLSRVEGSPQSSHRTTQTEGMSLLIQSALQRPGKKGVFCCLLNEAPEKIPISEMQPAVLLRIRFRIHAVGTLRQPAGTAVDWPSCHFGWDSTALAPATVAHEPGCWDVLLPLVSRVASITT